MAELSVIGNALEVVVAHSSFLVGRFATGVASSGSVFVFVPSKNLLFTLLDEFVLYVPKALQMNREREYKDVSTS